MSNKSDKPDLSHILENQKGPSEKNHFSAIEKFSNQIQSLITLIAQNPTDDLLLQTTLNLEKNAAVVVDQLKNETQTILKRFDRQLLPLAKEVLDGWLKEAETLKADLEESLKTVDKSRGENWLDCAKKWTLLNEKWHDLTKKVLKLAAERASQMIEKDIKVIKEYQDQTIANLPQESEEFINLQRRLYKATAEPLRNLVNLKNLPSEDLTIKQAIDWISNLQEERETVFDQVLIKIDSAVKEIVSKDFYEDDEISREIEGELAFIDREIKEVEKLLPKSHLLSTDEMCYLKERVQFLTGHLEDYDLSRLHNEIKEKINGIHQWIESTLKKL